MAISDKLTYLNDTKTQLKDMINYGLDTGEKITSETTFRNYVKSLFDAFIKTMTYPDVLYNNLPKVTGEGTSVTLNGTTEAPMRVELSPSALEQETTTGKNLLGLTDGTYSNNGITAVISNGKITLNGTATATSFIVFNLLNDIVLTNQTVTLSTNNSIAGGDSSTEIRVYTSSSSFIPCQFNTINSSITYTNKTETYTRFQIRTSSGVTYNNFVLYPQLEKGSSATTFENFTYGASPNPQYPQEIHTVSGDNTVEICGKNLIEGNTQHSYANSTNGIISIEKSSNKNQYLGFNDKTKVEPSTQYSVKFYEVSGSYSLFYTTYDSTGTYIKRKSFTSTDGTGTFTTDSNVYYVFCWLYSSSGPFTNDNTPIQLEKGSTATTYEPHQEQTYPLSLGDLEYCKIGNYEDLFFKNVVGSTYYDSTLELNKWYLKKNIGKVVLDGSNDESWGTSGTNPFYYYSALTNFIYKASIPQNTYCNLFTNKSIGSTNTELGYFIVNDGNVRFREETMKSIADWKIWLSTHNVIVYYVLATPTYTLLSDTLQTQLDNLAKAISYQEQTNVSQTNADLPFVIKMSAIRDLSGIFEEI